MKRAFVVEIAFLAGAVMGMTAFLCFSNMTDRSLGRFGKSAFLAFTGLYVALFTAESLIFKILQLAEVPLPGLSSQEKAIGRMIGYVERSLTFFLILDGSDSAVSMLIAAKGVFRIHELGAGEDRVNENKIYYIMIGTFCSIGYAIVVSILTKYLIGQVG
jgi:hypothetical protein